MTHCQHISPNEMIYERGTDALITITFCYGFKGHTWYAARDELPKNAWTNLHMNKSNEVYSSKASVIICTKCYSVQEKAYFLA